MGDVTTTANMQASPGGVPDSSPATATSTGTPAGPAAARAPAVPVAVQEIGWEDDAYTYEQRIETVARAKPIPPPPPPPPPEPPRIPQARAPRGGKEPWSRKARATLWGGISVGWIGSVLFALYYGKVLLWGGTAAAPEMPWPPPVVAPERNHSRELLERWRDERSRSPVWARLRDQHAAIEAAIKADGGGPDMIRGAQPAILHASQHGDRKGDR